MYILYKFLLYCIKLSFFFFLELSAFIYSSLEVQFCAKKYNTLQKVQIYINIICDLAYEVGPYVLSSFVLLSVEDPSCSSSCSGEYRQ